MKQHCRSCGAEVYWLEHYVTRRRAPIDAAPAAQGNITIAIMIDEYRVLNKSEAQRTRERGEPLYTNHFMTCPSASQWKGRKQSGGRVDAR